VLLEIYVYEDVVFLFFNSGIRGEAIAKVIYERTGAGSRKLCIFKVFENTRYFIGGREIYTLALGGTAP
jgi:hypothetical protein